MHLLCRRMTETTEFANSLFESGFDSLDNTRNVRKSYFTVKRTTVYLIACLATVVLVSNGVCMYLIASRKQDCKCVMPERQGFITYKDHTTTKVTDKQYNLTTHKNAVSTTTDKRYDLTTHKATTTTVATTEKRLKTTTYKENTYNTTDKRYDLTTHKDTVSTTTDKRYELTMHMDNTTTTTTDKRYELTTHMGNTTTTTTDKSVKTTEFLGCQTSWMSYGESCYFFSNESVTWLDAMIHCTKFDGYLVEITTAEEDVFLRRMAKQVVDVECYKKTPAQYKGLVSRTLYGLECQRWDSQFPHKHSRNNISRFPETSLADAANYCRDPDGEGMPWCYTTDPNTRWQFCPVYKCPGTFWIGMIKRREWSWVTSDMAISYTNWGPGMPSSSLSTCGSLSAKEFAWTDRKCFWPALYICET